MTKDEQQFSTAWDWAVPLRDGRRFSGHSPARAPGRKERACSRAPTGETAKSKGGLARFAGLMAGGMMTLKTVADSKSEERCRAEGPGATFKPTAEAAQPLPLADSRQVRLCSMKARGTTD
jgi:hypothetical protein